jgi:hypothetical protein
MRGAWEAESLEERASTPNSPGTGWLPVQPACAACALAKAQGTRPAAPVLCRRVRAAGSFTFSRQAFGLRA